ncbi:MAG: tripartite tricarboxylate transporter substrate binding protein [Betaproteobacteria bacterium]|nr:tripartite tricarboxylate transporter substrate binding protein [Betaproteobacteria bacterium]
MNSKLVTKRQNVLKRFGYVLVSYLAFAAVAAVAQSYPVKPMRMIIPYSPGGGNDIIGRLASAKLSEALGQQVIPENRPSAGGVIGADAVAKAAPDGYTMLLGHIGTLALNPTLRPDLPYNPVRSYQPITLLAKVPNILVVHPSLPVKTARDLIALAKNKPGALTYGSGGVGAIGHLCAEYFKQAAKVDILHVPYKGTGPALIDLMGGQIAMVFAGAAGITPIVQSGKLRAIGVSTLKRINTLPDVPTISESGLKDFEVTAWFGVVVPAGVPPAIVMKLNGVLVKSLQRNDMRKSLSKFAAEPVGDSPDEFGAFIKSEIARWAAVIKASNIKAD